MTPTEDKNDEAVRRRAELLQAVTAEYTGLLSLRSQVGTEVSFRAGLYFALLSSSIVALGFVAQRGQSLVLFTLILLPVIFVLGLFTFGRMTQNAVQFIIAGHGIDRIRRFFREIDPAHPELFPDIHPTDSGLMALGFFKFRWQGFLAATTTVATVNSAVGGTAAATLLGSAWTAIPLMGISDIWDRCRARFVGRLPPLSDESVAARSSCPARAAARRRS